ncbi:unnamed protein product [Ilex paraguariensis]|uniref:Uncharacterized protein n=1 Tax=Ilex paraguariensis TaxID=185542 RepID=A0ABC8RRS5_9AQUA
MNCKLVKDEKYISNGYLDTAVDWIPGMRDIWLRDLPSYMRTTDLNDFMFKFLGEEASNCMNASDIIFNTFDYLENEVLNAITSNVTLMTDQELIEFAWGLASRKKPFLWVLRPDIVLGNSAKLPEYFIEETKDRGLVVSWCPQDQVLSHCSVGGFLTHCGWNSMTVSISGGVPMICWPYIGEQYTNCRYTCKVWGIGVEIDPTVKREQVAEAIKELMEGEKGKEMKKEALQWKQKAENATRQGGSSYDNFDIFINEVLSIKGTTKILQIDGYL